MKKVLIVAALFFAAACQPNAATNQTTVSNVAVLTNNSSVSGNSSNAALSNSAADGRDKTKIRTFPGKGIVTKINLELGSVALDHEEIKGIMPPMQGMEFYVSDKKLLDGLKIGDQVDFVLEDNAGAEQIIAVKKK